MKAPTASRESVAEYFYEKALENCFDASECGIHEVTDTEKSGRGSKWLEMFFHDQNHQTEMRVYGPNFIMFRVWRPFMGKDGKYENVIIKTIREADRFFEDCLVRGNWTGRLAG